MRKLLLLILALFAISGCAVSQSENQDITVSQPQSNATISSPLTVEGEAKGTWFFEASFPAKLIDSNGTVIAQDLMQAKSDWQTEDLVEFEGTIEFTTDATEGELVLQKDNPSGLPENDAEIRIPVKFSK
ncbi:MAG: Gmad2 immunoglobulin-like domain-containing protein [Candidatus Gracilibacteria bacterium]